MWDKAQKNPIFKQRMMQFTAYPAFYQVPVDQMATQVSPQMNMGGMNPQSLINSNQQEAKQEQGV